MTSKEYCEGVLRTESGKFDTDHVDKQTLSVVFKTFIGAAQAVDAIKRALYYGKELNREKLNDALTQVNSALSEYKLLMIDNYKSELNEYCLPGYNKEPAVHPKITHAAIGLATESGEILEKILESFENNMELDYENLFEELSDQNWYIGLAIDTASKVDSCGSREWTFENVWEKNLAKLKVRYPNKFETDKAFSRDIEKEQAALK